MDEDMQKCCRICLDIETEHVPILGDPTIHLHLKSCLGITISPSDNFPKTVCNTCVTQLANFYNFQLNARCCQGWLESSLEEKAKKSNETKTPIQPLPDSEYNSDSLLEFLNNTANIEEYLNNLGKEDIPSIVNLLDKNENSIAMQMKPTKSTAPKKKEIGKPNTSFDMNMDIDAPDSDIGIAKELLVKKTAPKMKTKNIDSLLSCFACETKCENINKLSQHMSTCDAASRMCIHCHMLLDSKQKMQQHYLTHNILPAMSCNCGKQFENREKLAQHHKTCLVDYGAAIGCSYRCKQCGETFKERLQLFRHAREHVQKSEQQMCDVCGHSFTSKEALTKHKQEEHGKPDDLIYRCKVCNETSSSHSEMYAHVKKHTSVQEVPTQHLCESCGRSFSTQSSLSRHLALHGKKYQCNVCFVHFEDQKLLKRHALEHDKLIMCERCGKTVLNYEIAVHVCI